MSVIDDVRNNVDTDPMYSPVFAVVGVTDLAVEKARHAALRAEQVSAEIRTDLEPAKVQAKVKELPSAALNTTLTVAGRFSQGYESLVDRGHDLVERVRKQRTTQGLVHSAEATVERSKVAVDTAKKAAADVERSAKATIVTGRKEAERVVDEVADAAQVSLEVAKEEVKEAAVRTTKAAKRTRATAKAAAHRTTETAKVATESASRTANVAAVATKDAVEKVGD